MQTPLVSVRTGGSRSYHQS